MIAKTKIYATVNATGKNSMKSIIYNIHQKSIIQLKVEI